MCSVRPRGCVSTGRVECVCVSRDNKIVVAENWHVAAVAESRWWLWLIWVPASFITVM